MNGTFHIIRDGIMFGFDRRTRRQLHDHRAGPPRVRQHRDTIDEALEMIAVAHKRGYQIPAQFEAVAAT